jgi:SAM-dependent methyltransferase
MASPENRRVSDGDFTARVVRDLGAGLGAALVVLGDRLGLFRALAGGGALTPAELANETGTEERCVREWLYAQAAGDYVRYEASTGRFYLTPEQAAVLADSDSFAPGAFQIMQGVFAAVERAGVHYRTGAGMPWEQHAPGLFEGRERFLGALHRRHLVADWIPALHGVAAKLARGARVAEVGCGRGAATLLLARAHPASVFVGFDPDGASLADARRHATEAGLADRVTFQQTAADVYSCDGYDLVIHLDGLHCSGDPVAAARHVRQTLAPDGTWMIVEPFAHDRLEQNLTPSGRLFYAMSAVVSVPAALAQGGLALGAQAGEARLRDVALEAGFRRLRRVAETPFSIVLEATSTTSNQGEPSCDQ